jgi:hypothetical protein
LVRIGSAGGDRPGTVGNDLARHGRRGMEGLDWDRQRMAWIGRLGEAWRGAARSGAEWSGTARTGRRGMERRCVDWTGEDWLGRRGRQGGARHGEDRTGTAGPQKQTPGAIGTGRLTGDSIKGYPTAYGLRVARR